MFYFKKTNMRLRVFKCILVLLLFSSAITYSQETKGEKEETNQESEKFKRHSIGFFLSHSHINQSRIDGEKSWVSAPSLALNYNYLFNEKWGLGWHNDLIIEKFIVEDTRENKTELERSYPFSTMLVGFYKPSESWSLALGGGAEYEENETFGLIRIGTEYGIPIPDLELEVLFSFNYDILIDAYDSINFGIGIAKSF